VTRKLVSLLRSPPAALRVACAIAFAVLVAGLFVVGSMPVAAGLLRAPWDKLAHFAHFGLLTVLLLLATRGRRPLAVFLAVCAVGVADELFQSRLPGRYATWGDLAVDVFAAGVMVVVVRQWMKGTQAAADDQPPRADS